MRERPLLLQFIPHGDPSSPVVHSWHWSHLWMASHIQLLCYPQWLNILTSKKVCELLSCLCLLYQLMTLIYVPHESANTHKLPQTRHSYMYYISCISVALVSTDAMHMVTGLFDTMNPTVLYCWVNRAGCRDWQLWFWVLYLPFLQVNVFTNDVR